VWAAAMIDTLEIPAPGAVDDVAERGLIFPIPGAQKNTIVFEPRDGESIQSLTAKALEFKVGNRTMLRVRKVRIDIFITDSRFALACSKYDKGGGWVGGATAMVAFNTVSKARAALRSRGKMLAGQVRYPWLRWVASAPKTGFASEETLVLQCAAENGTAMTLRLTLPKNIDASRVAAEIADRAARYRLASEELDPEARAGIEGHLDSQSRVPAGGEKQAFEMAAPWPVGEHSARFAPQAAVVTAPGRAATEPGPEPASPSALATAFCASCGEEVAVDDVFCSACGGPTLAADQTDPESDGEPAEGQPAREPTAGAGEAPPPAAVVTNVGGTTFFDLGTVADAGSENPTELECAACGEEVGVEDVFCSACGERVGK
jgi:hypothetical protein